MITYLVVFYSYFMGKTDETCILVIKKNNLPN